MNLRTYLLRGVSAVFALTLFASLNAQTITFTSDGWPQEMTSCVVTFLHPDSLVADTIFNQGAEVIWPGLPTNSDSQPFNVGIYGVGVYTVSMNDTYGDGGSAWSVDGGALNVCGQSSGEVAACFTTTGPPCLETWSFSLSDGDCPIVVVEGCTDPEATNYDEAATDDDGSCTYPVDPCPGQDQTTVLLTMGDSYGDGWNGATYEIYNGDELLFSGSLDDADYVESGGFAGGPATGVDSLCFPASLDGECITVIAGGGSWDNEISWELTNFATGAEIAGPFGAGAVTFAFGNPDGVCGCDEEDAVNYDPTATINDGSCVFSCDIQVRLEMTDTWGDGWNGASYTLTDASGLPVATGSLDAAQFPGSAPGTSGYDLFCVADSSCFTLEVGGGFYDTEVGWTLIDNATEEVLASGNAPSGAGSFSISTTGVVCGCATEGAFNFDPDATADDGTCVIFSCDGDTATSYILHLTHSQFNFWGGNGVYMYNAAGDTLLESGYLDGDYAPDLQPSIFEGFWEFCIPNDQCLQLSAGGGSPTGSATWEILSTDSVVLHSGGLGVYDVGFGTESDCVWGCTSVDALNFDALATVDDGSCIVCDNAELVLNLTLHDDFGNGWSDGNNYYLVSEETGDTVLTGTMEPGQTTTSYLSCLPIGCYMFSTDDIFSTEGFSISDNVGNVYAPLTYGSTEGYPIAFGGPDAFTEENSCGFEGCTDSNAINYVLSADIDDDSCEYLPVNNDPETATAIGCDMSLTGTLENATGDEYNGTTVLGNPISNNGAIWFEYNAFSDAQVTFDLCESQNAVNGVTDTDVIVFVENSDSTLTVVGTNDDSLIPGCGAFAGYNSLVSINAYQGNTYLVRVSTWASSTPETGIVIQTSCAECPSGFPINDDVCTSSLPLPVGGIFAEESLCCSGADEDFGMPGLNFYATSYGVWYTVQPDDSLNLLTINVDATGDGAVGYALYAGPDCTNLTALTSGGVEGLVETELTGYSFALSAEAADIEFFLDSLDAPHYLYVWTTDLETCGSYSVSMSGEVAGCTDPEADNYNEAATVNTGCEYSAAVSANDSCSAAVAIACNETLSGNTGGATSNGDNPCTGNPAAGVWYTFDNGGTSQLVTVSTCGSSADANFSIFQEVDAPDAILEVTNINPDNIGNLSAAIYLNGELHDTIPAGEFLPTVFQNFYHVLDGGDYTVYFYNNATGDLDGISASVISSDGAAQNLLCSGECEPATAPVVNLTIDTDIWWYETSWDITNEAGDIVASGAPTSGDLYSTDITLDSNSGSYTLTVYDSFGDGISGPGEVNLSSGAAVYVDGGEVTGDGSSWTFDFEFSPYNLPAGGTVSQSFSIFGGTGVCSSLLCFTEGDNTVTLNESCENGETLQFISDEDANTYAILVAAGSGNPLGGPFDLSVSCEAVVYGCSDELACNYNSEANVDDVDNPCEYVSCLGCTEESWSYCYGDNEEWSFQMNNSSGDSIIVIDLAGTSIQSFYDELTIADAATGAPLYNSNEDPDDSVVIGLDSVIVSFTSNSFGSCAGDTLFGFFGINMAISCATPPLTGCADSTACNFAGDVDFADNSLCDFSCLGCIDDTAVNYSPFATVDDGTCCYGEAYIEFNMTDFGFFFGGGDGWNGATYSFFNGNDSLLATGSLEIDENDGDFDTDNLCFDTAECMTLVVTEGDAPFELGWSITSGSVVIAEGGPGTFTIGVGTDCVEGCGLPFAQNYSAPDTTDIVNNNLCDFDGYIMGCTYPDASNYGLDVLGNPLPDDMMPPTNDDGSCIFDTASPCPTDLNDDGQTTTSDLLIFLGAFGTTCD